ncbi:MAG: glycerol kinase GlpK [Spirochaetales bacterium]|jgi:glycerol kinase|nr:glycerol kinase GlpK [Spirochaetales bacterium]
MERRFILGIDQGSTGSKILLVDDQGEVVKSAYRPVASYYPQEGWLEHDPEELWRSVEEGLEEVVQGLRGENPRAIGITNQRETAIIWDRAEGRALTPAISWQCNRTISIIEGWRPLWDEILAKTGLVCSAYYSASKILWMLENNPSLRRRAEKGELCFGTVNTWLIYKLTGGKIHATDSTNAGRTMLFDIEKNSWDENLIRQMEIPPSLLPGVLPCDGDYGEAVYPREVFPKGVPIQSCIGDQQSALVGQACFSRGEAKCTIGTCINLVTQTQKLERTTGSVPPSIAFNLSGRLQYDLEGGVYVAGSINDFLIDQLGMAKTPQEVSALAQGVDSADGVYVVPAFQGLGSPYWNANARGLFIGLSRYHTKAHVFRAALESMALQTNDVVIELKEKCGVSVNLLRVDGGVARNDFILQGFADIIGCRIERPKNTDRTPMGAVYIAGLASGLWKGTEELKSLWKLDRAYEPEMNSARREELLGGWKEAVKRSLDWANQPGKAGEGRRPG